MLRHLRSLLLPTLLLPFASAFAAPGDPAVLKDDPTIKAAFAAALKNEPEMIELQVKLCEIPAPPFKEEKRAAALKALFEQYGLKNVFIDKVGNVVGTRPGAKAHPNVVLAAHLDTVFPEGTDVTVKREVNLLKAPGIGDDTRGLASMLAVLRALNDGKVQTPGTITFVADVGEEGLGDLRGIKALFADTLKDQIDYFISIDGSDPAHIVFAGVGSYRYRVTFKGPGGHSYGAFGLVNPVHALGRAVAKIDNIQVPANPKTTFNVGVIGGGTSVNSIPFEGWFEVDMRSPDAKSLETTKEKIHAAINEAVVEENERWKHKGEITVDIKLVGYRPVGQTPPESPIVVAAQTAARAINLRPLLMPGSTDSNVPMQLGIPAVTIGGGGIAKDAHALSESFDPTDSYKGVQAALLLVTALAQ